MSSEYLLYILDYWINVNVFEIITHSAEWRFFDTFIFRLLITDCNDTVQ